MCWWHRLSCISSEAAAAIVGSTHCDRSAATWADIDSGLSITTPRFLTASATLTRDEKRRHSAATWNCLSTVLNGITQSYLPHTRFIPVWAENITRTRNELINIAAHLPTIGWRKLFRDWNPAWHHRCIHGQSVVEKLNWGRIWLPIYHSL